MKMMAKSQPNLLACLQQEELEAAGVTKEEEHRDQSDQDHFSLNSVNQLRDTLSVHNLLDEGMTFIN